MPRVSLPGGPGLAAEAGRDPGVAQGQRARLDDLVGVQGGQRRPPRCRPGTARPSGPRRSSPARRGRTRSRRAPTRERGPAGRPASKPSSPSDLDGEADQRQLEQDQVAHQVGEAGARGRRRLLGLDQAERPAEVEVIARPRSRTPAARRPRAGRPRPRRSRRRGRRGRAGWGSSPPARERSVSTVSSSASSSLIRAETSRIRAIASSASPPSRLAAPIASEASLRCGPQALRPREAARGGGASSSSRRSRSSAAPTRASAARAGAGSSRMRRRSSTG